MSDLDELKSLLRGLLISNTQVMTVADLQKDFRSQEGRDIPYRNHGYNTLLEFLHAIPDAVQIEHSTSRNPVVTPVLTEKLSHVDALVQRQKINPPKKGRRNAAPILRRSSVKVPERANILVPHNLQEKLFRMVTETNTQVPSRPYCRLYPNYEINPRVLIPHDIQMRIHELSMRHYQVPSRPHTRPYPNYEINPRVLFPHDLQMRIRELSMRHYQGLPLSVIKQQLRPEVLYNYGVTCSIEELIQNLGHLIQLHHGWVYPKPDPEHMCNFPQPQANVGASYNNFMPTWAERNDSSMKQSCDNRTHSAGSGRIRSPLGSPTGFQELRSVELELQRNAQQKKMDFNSDSSEHKPAGYESSISPKSDSYIKNAKWENQYEDGFSDDNFNADTQKETSNACESPEKNGKDNTSSCNSSPDCYSKLLVNNVMRRNLQILLEKRPDGIWCSELPNLYKEHFRLELDYRSLGFVSVVQMTSNLPDIFHTVRQDGGDWKVFDSRKSLPQHYQPKRSEPLQDLSPEVPIGIRRNIERMLMYYPGGLSSDQFLQKYQDMFDKSINVRDFNFGSLESFLLSLNDTALHMRYLKEKIQIYPRAKESESSITDPLPHMKIELADLYPPEVVGLRHTIPQQKLSSNIGPGSYLEVLVAEVYNPSKFWIQLRGEKTHLALDQLMNQMQEFYEEYEYNMPEQTMLVGQFCVALYNGEWHRAQITGFPKGETGPATVFYVDYGTVKAVNKSDLRFLHKSFANFPMQAIRASLANIRPAGGKTKWENEISKRFLSLVSEKTLIALVSSVDKEKHQVDIALVDTTQDEDIHINDLLKHEGLAEYGTGELKEPKRADESKLPAPSPVKTEPTPSSVLTEVTTQPPQRVGLSVSRPPPGFAAASVSPVEMPTPTPATSLPSLLSAVTSSVQSMTVTTPAVTMPSVMSQAYKLNVTTNAPSQNQSFMQQQQQQQPCFMPSAANAPSLVNSLYNPLLTNASQYLAQSQFVQQQPPQQQMALDLMLQHQQQQQLMHNMMLNPFTAMLCNQQIAAVAAAAASNNPYAAAAAATNNSYAAAAVAAATAAIMGNSLTNAFGMPMVNPTMLYPQQVPNKTANLGPLEVNISEVPTSPICTTPSNLLVQSTSQSMNQSPSSEPIITAPPSPPIVQDPKEFSPVTEPSLFDSVSVEVELNNLKTLKMGKMNVLSSTEHHATMPTDSSKKTAESTSSSDSNVLEQFDIVTKLDAQTENAEPEPVSAIEDFEIYRSEDEETEDVHVDDDEPDAIVEKEIEEIIKNVKKPQLVKKVELARKTIHIMNVKSVPHLCTDEVVRLFTEFSGRHVILKILDSKNISLPFRELSRSEEPNLITALDSEEVIGVPKVNGIIVGKVHVTPLLALPQLMTMLNMQNREVFRAAHEEIEQYNSQPSYYWMQ